MAGAAPTAAAPRLSAPQSYKRYYTMPVPAAQGRFSPRPRARRAARRFSLAASVLSPGGGRGGFPPRRVCHIPGTAAAPVSSPLRPVYRGTSGRSTPLSAVPVLSSGQAAVLGPSPPRPAYPRGGRRAASLSAASVLSPARRPRRSLFAAAASLPPRRTAGLRSVFSSRPPPLPRNAGRPASRPPVKAGGAPPDAKKPTPTAPALFLFLRPGISRVSRVSRVSRIRRARRAHCTRCAHCAHRSSGRLPVRRAIFLRSPKMATPR